MEWSDNAILQQPVGELPWSHIVSLLDKLDDLALRNWYTGKDVHQDWSRVVLVHQMATRLYEREREASSNFANALNSPDSELAQQITKAPYFLCFLAIDSETSRRELEDQLTAQIGPAVVRTRSVLWTTLVPNASWPR
ncbi:putative nuclease of restriction endonuclease-like (RecB) superfamily [Subtercola frigoramans]|uniref:Nuclease of restriction endonuclease-like (RecB) superfamily n=1 Tax=Subtercola frigoramans TaxID=120298 RepID=A0ABS2L0Y3_9MICO|nr:putative nuclease of restriction endonuclease-like (RecB) superfamily [Subtercola frigoramans]